MFRQNLSKVESMTDESGVETYANIIFHPVKDVKSFKDIQDVQLTGYRIFLESGSLGIKLRLFPIEFITPRNSYPHWSAVSKEAIEQIDASDDILKEFELFKEEYKKWKDSDAEVKLENITKEFEDYQQKLTFEDPFQTFMNHVVEKQLADNNSVDSYQQEPEIMNFERE